MQLVEVTDKTTAKNFFRLPFKLYKDDPHWISPLKQDIEKIFDPEKNRLFKKGKARRWLLYNEYDELIGRIAAFINPGYKFNQPTGGIGFFDCVNDQESANILFSEAEEWLKENGMEAMDGPINFGEKNMFWGLLSKNFDEPPSYGMNYNPPYYRDLFENYGFQLFYKQLVYHRGMEVANEVFVEKSRHLFDDPDFHCSNVRGYKIPQIAADFLKVYNEAWGRHEGFRELNEEKALKTIKAMKQVMDPDIIIFAYYKKVPIGFFINLPELNQIFKYVNGELNWIGKLKFLYHKWRRTPDRLNGLIFGVVPEWQGKGVEGAMIKYASDTILPLNRYKDVIMTWIGDFNPKMIRICENLGAEVHREYITYRKLFDPNKPFERHPILE